MKRFCIRLLVIPALLLLVASEANAQRRGGFGVSVGTGGFGSPGFGYSTGYRGGNGFGYGYPGYGYGYNGFNRGFGYSPYGYGYGGTGITLSLGNNSNRYGYGNYYAPAYSTGYYPTYSTTSVPMMSSSFYQPTYSTNGITQMSYTIPSYTTESGVVQTSGYYSPAVSAVPAAARVKLTVPERAEVWVDGKETEGTGTTREFTTDALASWTNVKVKIKDGDSTREFTMPVRPGEDSRVDLSPLLR